MEQVGLVETAFQIAHECASLDELRQRLAREGYPNVHAYLSGPQIRRQLYELLDPARKKPWPRGRIARQSGEL